MAVEVQAEQLVIGGRAAASEAAQTLVVHSPDDGQPVGTIPAGCAQDVDLAVAAARDAAAGWASLTYADRAGAIAAMLDALEACADEIARAQSKEMGQPLEMARSFLVETLAGAREELAGAASQDETDLDGGYLVHEPRGVAALIVPWNFPIPIAIQGLVPLLATGNTVIWKPSERSPLSAVVAMQAIADLLPPGVLNLILGDGRAGEPLAAHQDVDLVLFTGSVQSGKRVAELAAGRLAKVVLELGGKDPVIVDSGVDAAWAADVVAQGAMLNAGQICTSMERIYVHAEIADEFTAALCAAVPGAAGSQPLVDARQREIVDSHVQTAVADGARLLLGGERPDGPGFHYPPTVLVDVPQDTPLMREETFGPVAALHTVKDFDEALSLANDTTYGLAATVLTDDPEHAAQAGRRLRASIVWINEWQGAVDGAQAEPQLLSGLGTGFGPGLWSELRTTRYVHSGSATPRER